MTTTTITRREMLTASMAAGFGLAFAPMLQAAPGKKRAFKIGACDWSLGKRASFESFDVAEKIGLDGVQVSFNPPGQGVDLRIAANRKKYLDICKAKNMQITSLAMGILNLKKGW